MRNADKGSGTIVGVTRRSPEPSHVVKWRKGGGWRTGEKPVVATVGRVMVFISTTPIPIGLIPIPMPI